MTRPNLARLIIALFLVLAPVRVDAQIGSLIKKKVGDAVKGTDKEPATKKGDAQNADASSKSPFGNTDILEITPPVLEGFIRGLKTEIALTKEFRAELAKYPTPEQRQQCETKWAQSPEVMKMMTEFSVPENVSVDQARAAVEKHTKDMNDAMTKQCPDDVDRVWQASKRRERIEQIKEKAAASAGADAPSSSGSGDLQSESGPFVASEPLLGQFVALRGAAGLTVHQYGILLERTKRFCDELKTAAGKNLGGSGGVKFPGSGGGIFWVYTATEAKTLSQANCQRVYDLVGQLL
jgi:hypothetical protein